MQAHTKARPLFDPEIARGALVASFTKLDPRHQVRNPVMFVVLVGSVLTTLLFVQALLGRGEAPAGFILAVSLWLWFTVLFANFAEAMAEGRGKAQADRFGLSNHHPYRMAEGAAALLQPVSSTSSGTSPPSTDRDSRPEPRDSRPPTLQSAGNAKAMPRVRLALEPTHVC
jgi:high-affinity K+ transport system ATPase subunit B